MRSGSADSRGTWSPGAVRLGTGSIPSFAGIAGVIAVAARTSPGIGSSCQMSRVSALWAARQWLRSSVESAGFRVAAHCRVSAIS